MNTVLFNGGRGNEEFANMPRKINVCVSPSRDDFPHTQVGLQVVLCSLKRAQHTSMGRQQGAQLRTRSHIAQTAASTIVLHAH